MAKEFNFKLKSDAKEYPSRFGGNEVTLTLPEKLSDIPVADGVDRDTVILGLVTGQGLRLSKQKKVKDVLASDEVKEMDVPTALEHARKAAEEMQFGAPRAKGEGGRKSKRVAEAEAKAEDATNMLRDTFLSVPAAVRKNLRPQLVAKFGEETVAAWEQDAK